MLMALRSRDGELPYADYRRTPVVDGTAEFTATELDWGNVVGFALYDDGVEIYSGPFSIPRTMMKGHTLRVRIEENPNAKTEQA